MSVFLMTLEELMSDLSESLMRFNVSLSEFASMNLNEIDNWELRDLWLMFHDEAVMWCNESALIPA